MCICCRHYFDALDLCVFKKAQKHHTTYCQNEEKM